MLSLFATSDSGQTWSRVVVVAPGTIADGLGQLLYDGRENGTFRRQDLAVGALWLTLK